MRKKLSGSSLVIIALMSLIAQSSRADDMSTDLGFHRLDSSSPQAIISAADSVFEIRIPGGETKSAASVLDLSSPSLQNIGARIDLDPDLDALGKIVAKKQIENCQRVHLETRCLVSHTMVKATAFLAGGDGSVLFTNAHVVDDYFKLLKVLSPQTTVSDFIAATAALPIFLFDRNGQLVFDPYLSGAKIKKIGAPSGLSKARGTWFSEDSDYVIVKIGKVIGKPIPIAKAGEAGEKVWHIGYPACTGCARSANVTDPALNRSRKEVGDSAGVGFYWTPAGEIVSTGMAKSHLDHLEETEKLLNWTGMIFFNSDSQVGMSGGPILNAGGEVIGLYAGSKPLIDGRGKMNVLSRGVRPVEFDVDR